MLRDHCTQRRATSPPPSGTSLYDYPLLKAHWRQLYDARTGKRFRPAFGHVGAGTSVIIGPRGRLLAHGSEDGTVKLWDLACGRIRAVLRNGDTWNRSVSFDGRARLLAAANDHGQIKIWDASSGKHRRTLRCPKGLASRAVALSPNGNHIASACGSVLHLWNTQSGALVRKLKVRPGSRCLITAVRYSPDSRWIAAGCENDSDEGWVRIWSPTSYKVRYNASGHTPRFSSNGRLLAVARWIAQRPQQSVVDVHDLRLMKRLHTLYGRRNAGRRTGDFSFVGSQKIAVARFDSLLVHEALSGNIVGSMQLAHNNPETALVGSLSVGPRGRLLATTSSVPGRLSFATQRIYVDPTIKLWDLRRSKLLAVLASSDTKQWVVYTPDGYVDASSSGRRMIQWKTNRSYPWPLVWHRQYVPGLLARIRISDGSFRLSALRALF